MTTENYLGPLKAFVNHPHQWHAFEQFISDEIASMNRKMLQSDNMTDVARSQGAVHQLSRILKLKEMCNAERK